MSEKRYAMALEYDGAAYMGWQKLSHGPSVQAAVEQALSKVADHPLSVQCAGRTDSGVHARMQVIHFESTAKRSEYAWQMGCNSNLPDDISSAWCVEVNNDFHARYSAISRKYIYRIINRRYRPAIDRNRMAWVREPLDAALMNEAAVCLIGEHDFSAFRASACQAKTPNRNIQQVDVFRENACVEIHIRANAFLHHMVRNIVGSLVCIGKGEKPVNWMQALLEGKDRTLAAATAPASGLTLEDVEYPGHFVLPGIQQ